MNEKQELTFRRQTHELPAQMAVMKQRLFDAGLIRSAHLLDKVTTELGWEMAERITGKDPRP